MNVAERIEELESVLAGLAQLDRDLRQNAANGLGRVDHLQMTAMAAQATLLASVMQTLGQRVETLRGLAAPRAADNEAGSVLPKRQKTRPKLVTTEEDTNGNDA